MTQSSAWLLQVASDLSAAQKVYKANDPTTFCQALSKYQQAVEKSSKSVFASLHEAGIHFEAITPNHDPSRQLQTLIASRRVLGEDLLSQVRRIFTDGRIAEVRRLCSLAPKYPSQGSAVFPKNTEYPFSGTTLSDWIAPASPEAFTKAEVQQAHKLAWLLKNQADRFAEILKLRPRRRRN